MSYTRNISMTFGMSKNSSRSSSRSSFHSTQTPRDIEADYPPWWTTELLLRWLRDLPDDTFWNSFVCCMALCAIVWVAVDFVGVYLVILDAVYNLVYAVHVVALAYQVTSDWESFDDTSFRTLFSFLVDLATFSHYVGQQSNYNLICYYLRLHRPFRYLWALNDYNMKGSVLGTALKYCYIFMVLRVTWALIWYSLEENEYILVANKTIPADWSSTSNLPLVNGSVAFHYLFVLYMVNKMFIPIGPTVAPENDQERITCLLVMISGCLVVTGAAVASLSLVISLYLRPEETFRSRYRRIMKEMKECHIPQNVRCKVQTFYKMYWHNHRAVSSTQLLPTFPPTLPATIFTDIYFEATQKSSLLRNYSYQFLSELAKKMETINYIPGDAIIRRSSKRSSMIFITHGDVEMLTAEDDNTPILRMTRGSLFSPGGVTVVAALGRAHLEMRAATFCTAHILRAADLWRVILKHSTSNDNGGQLLKCFNEHLDNVRRHYSTRVPDNAQFKSSILRFKRNLMALKEAWDSKGQLLLARTDYFLEVAGHYLMRNLAASCLSDESDKICLRPTFPCILQPASSLQVAWNTFVAAIILTVCFTHPYYVVFKNHVPMEFKLFDYAVTAVFVLDLIVHLSTGANVEAGVPITFSQTSSQQCRDHWFMLDVIGTLPILEFVGDGRFAGLNKILRIPKLFRVLKSLEETTMYSNTVIRFLSYTLLLLIACYLIAALQQGYLCYKFDYCLITNFTHSPYWAKQPMGNSVKEQLAFGLYWSISMITFTTHKDSQGRQESWTAVQRILYTMLVLEICIVLRIFIESVYSATIMVTTSLREDYDACIETVKNFLIRNQVDPQLRQRFIDYLQLSWYTDKAYNMTHKKNSIFYDLPPHVSQDIVARQRSKYILCIPIMTLLRKDALKDISTNARLFLTSPNEILLNTGDFSSEMYVIKQGICEVLSPDTKKVMGLLTSKNHFGVLACLCRFPAYYTVRTVTHVQVFSISRKHLTEALEMPQIKQAIDFVRTLPEYTRLLERREPFVSYEPPPPTPNREWFRLPRKYERDFEFLQPFNKLGFLSILRYIFPRFTIRPDGQYLLRYEWFRVSCALVSAIVFPSYAYMVLQMPWLYHLTLFLDFTAWFDIFQRMLIGYFNEDGILVYHPSSTAAHYMKGAFMIDLLGCLALDNLEAPRKESCQNKFVVTPMMQFLLLNRLLQLYRLKSVLQVLPIYVERRDIRIIITSIPIFISLLNVMICLVVFNSVEIFFWVDQGAVTKWEIRPIETLSWINLFENAFRFKMTETPLNLHLAVQFWVVYEATSTGYNVFNPSNIGLMQIFFIGMACSAMITTYFSVRIISVRAQVNKPLAAFQEHMKDITVFMRRENLDPVLQKEVLQYYEYNWDKMGGIDYRGVLKLCDQITLRTDAIVHIFGPTFAKCPILNQSDVSLLRIVGRAVHSVYFLRGMHIVHSDDVISDMYFVDYGGVDMRVSDGALCTVVKLPKGSVFGNLEPVSADRCPVSFVATSRLHLLKINSLAFHHIIANVPAVGRLINTYRNDNKYCILGNITEQLRAQRRRISVTPTPAAARGRRGLLHYIYFQDSIINTYLITVCLLCVYADVYNAGFQDNRLWLIVGLYVLDVCFYLKILLQYSIPMVVDSLETRRFLLPMRRAYFKGEFKYDILSCIPFELLSFLSLQHSWLVFSLLRINRTLRMVTVYSCLKSSHERVTVNLLMSTVVSVLVWFTFFVHSTSCLWHFVALMQDRAQPKSSWIYKDSGESWCDDSYVCSLYFVLTTFTQNGVGDILPKNHVEVALVSVLMVVSTLVYMVYAGEFSNLLQYAHFRSAAFYSHHLELQEFLKNNRVSKNLVSLVNKYSLHLWRESRGLQVPHFLSIAPHCLRLNVMSAAYLQHLTRHHIFEDCERAFLRQLVGCLQPYSYNEGMYVVKESEITNAMYFIHKGEVRESAAGTRSTAALSRRVYPPGSYFGVGFVRDTPYSDSYQTIRKSQVLTLLLDDWEYLLEHFPRSKEVIYHNMQNLGNQNHDNWPGGGKWLRKPTSGVTFLESIRPPPPPPPSGGISTREPQKTPEQVTEQSTKIPTFIAEEDKLDEEALLNESVHVENRAMRALEQTRSFKQPPEQSNEQSTEILKFKTSEVKLDEEALLDEPVNIENRAMRALEQTRSFKSETSEWPLDNRHYDTESDDQDQGKYEEKGRSEGSVGPQYIAETKSKLAFMEKVKMSARKLMGRSVSEVDLKPSTSSYQVKDELLLQEDEETTEALLRQMKHSEKPKESTGSDVKPLKVEFSKPDEDLRLIEDTDDYIRQSSIKTSKHSGIQFQELPSTAPLNQQQEGQEIQDQEEPTSTAKLNRRFIRVRYDNEDETDVDAIVKQPQSTRSEFNTQVRDVNEAHSNKEVTQKSDEILAQSELTRTSTSSSSSDVSNVSSLKRSTTTTRRQSKPDAN